MNEYRSDRNKKRIWVVTVVLLLAAGLFVAAMAEPKQQSSEKWVPLNRSVEAALQEDEQDELNVQGEQDKKSTHTEKKPDSDQKVVGSDEKGQLIDKNNATVTSNETSGDQAEDKESMINKNIDTIASESSADNGRMDINRATAEELDSLKGIGPAKAQAIVDDRNLNGQFSSIGDLQRVKGIGPKLLEGVKDSIVARP
ncbi:MAG: ComEA family DNA-binding protein [Candidatus Pristimantibacillus sp.]